MLTHRVPRAVSHHHEKKEIHAIWLTPRQLEILWPAAARRSSVCSCKRMTFKMACNARDVISIQRVRWVSLMYLRIVWHAYHSVDDQMVHHCISECDLCPPIRRKTFKISFQFFFEGREILNCLMKYNHFNNYYWSSSIQSILDFTTSKWKRFFVSYTH